MAGIFKENLNAGIKRKQVSKITFLPETEESNFSK